jgi:hypothetical protein
MLVAEVGHSSGEAPSGLLVAFAAVSPTAVVASPAADFEVARHETEGLCPACKPRPPRFMDDGQEWELGKGSRETM